MAVQSSADATTLRNRNASRSRQVWVVLLVSVALFLSICAALTFGLALFLSSITNTETASIKAVATSVLAVKRYNTNSPEFITGTTTLQQGDSATTQGTDEAFINLFGDSGTIQLFFNSNLEMERLRESRFFQNSKEVAVLLHKGTAVFATGGLGDYSSATYTLSTDQAEIDIAPNSFVLVQIEMQQETPVTEVVVNSGSATMLAHGKRVELGAQQMAWVSGSDEPQGPTEAQKDLVQNGAFDQPPNSSIEQVSEGGLGTAAWLPLRDPSGLPSSPATVEITDEVNLRAAALTGEGSPDRYVQVGISQDINAPASFYNTIALSATIKVVNQSAPAGGPANDVYPLTIRVVYTDQSHGIHEWKRSFYFQGPDPSLTDNSFIKIAQGRWISTQEMQEQKAQAIKSSNLSPAQQADALANNSNMFILKSPDEPADIAVINAIWVYGYGDHFQSWVTNISLMAR